MIWMNEKPFDSSREYIIRHNGRNIKSRLDSILYNIDVNTLEKKDVDKLQLNENRQSCDFNDSSHTFRRLLKEP